MAVSMNLYHPNPKYMQIKQFHKNKKTHNSSSYSHYYHNHNHNHNHHPGWVILDMIIILSAIGAMSYLLYPYVTFTYTNVANIGSLVGSTLKHEMYENPMSVCLGLSMAFVVIATWGVVICLNTRKCGNPNCRGLNKAPGFGIEIETEECVGNFNSIANGGVERGWLFELFRDHGREFETELKKIAPINGRAVVVFRARCGCCVGRMEVPGSKKGRRIKK